MAWQNIGRAMELKIEIDSKSGFCYGVVRAIEQAEKFLSSGESLTSLGSIVHNSSELKRLEKRGLKVVDSSGLNNIAGGNVLFRAHGEPPQSYEVAKANSLNVIDCTCPVVLKLQERVRDSYSKIKPEGGTVAIFGKKGHAEVNGLAGQVGGDVVILQSIADIEKLNLMSPLNIFSQTTKDKDHYRELCKEIERRIEAAGGPIDKFKAFNTICGQVSSRLPHLREFAAKHNVIIFVSGAESSNGKVLYDLCKKVNERSYKIESSTEINRDWFNEGESVGICGATSTPSWQLEEVANYLSTL